MSTEEILHLENLLTESETLRSSDPSAAIDAGLRAITLARNLKHLAGQTRAYYILSSIFLNIEDFKKAITYAGLSIRFAKQHGYTVHLAGALCIKASSEVRLLDIKKAIRDFFETMNQLEKQPDPRFEGYLYKSIATTLRGLRRLDCVDMASELSCSTYRTLNSDLFTHAGLAAQMHNLAEVARFLPKANEKQSQIALKKLEKLITQFDFDSENRIPLSDALQARADFYALTNKPEKAQEDYRSITAFADAFQMLNVKTFAIARSAQLYAEENDTELAVIQIDRAVKLREFSREKFEDAMITEALLRAAELTNHPLKSTFQNSHLAQTEKRIQLVEEAIDDIEDLEERIRDSFRAVLKSKE